MYENVYSALLQAWSVSKTSGANVFGVEIAIVTNNKDPEKQGRVKICFPRLPGKPESDWARVCQPAAGGGRGFYWLPEVSDEVLVAFERGQTNLPYVIGALWNGKDKPMKDAYSDENTRRMIQSKSGHQILFEDKGGEEKISITDKTGKRTVTWDVKEKKFLVEAKEGDVEIHAKKKLVLACEDLEIKTTKTGKLQIGSKFELKVAQKASFKAGPKMDLKADKVNLNPPSLDLASLAAAALAKLARAAAAAAGASAEQQQKAAQAGSAAGAALGGAAASAAGGLVPTKDVAPGAASGAAGAGKAGPGETQGSQWTQEIQGKAGQASGGSQGGAAAQPGGGTQEGESPAAGDLLVTLQDESGNPASGIAWEVTMPDGSKRTGTTGSDGKVMVKDAEQSGQYKLVLPGIDQGGQQAPPGEAPPQDQPAAPPAQGEPEEPPAQTQPGEQPAPEPEPQGALKSILFASPAMKAWIADAAATPIKKGDSRKMLVRAARLGIFALQKPGNTPYGVEKKNPNTFNDNLEAGVKKFQQQHADDDLSAIGEEAGALKVTGQVDKVTALLIDHLLQQDQPKTAGMPYKPVTVNRSEIPAEGPGELARRCMEVLHWWASEKIPYSPSGTDNPFVHPVGFGNAWFLGTRTATCSPSTAAALFWACGGMLNGKHFAHDDLFYTAYSQWQIFQHRQDFPDAAAGAVETLQIGASIELTDDESQAAAGDPVKILHFKVNKLRKGDLVQGWRVAYTPPPDDAKKPPDGWKKKDHKSSEPDYAAYVKYLDWQLQMDGGHSFFITKVDPPDKSGNVPGYSILTANNEGVSEKPVPWNRWKDIRIARFFRIEGE